MNRLPKPGEAFSPFRVFTSLFVPEALARCRSVSGGAKLAYGRLVRYAGEDGRCFPTVKTLGNEIGVGVRQAQKYLAELERAKLIRRIDRYVNGGQTSNGYQFLWHEMFGGGGERSFREGVNDDAPRGVNDRSPKESQIEESPSEEKHRLRLSGRESQKTRFPPRDRDSACKQYPDLKEALADYMQDGAEDERVYPTDRHSVDIMNAAGGASEAEVITCLRYLRDERGLGYGTRNGPRQFSWFPTVVGDYFRRKREREEVANPPPTPHGTGFLGPAELDAMTEAIEIAGAQTL